MDANRFDTITRLFAARPLSRRAALAAAAGLLAAGARGAGAQVSQADCGNKTCGNNPARCNDACVCCVYPNGSSRCRPPGSCGAGVAICPEGEMADPVQGCIPLSTAGNSSVDWTDPTFPEESCVPSSFNYDPIVFDHAGGPMSLRVRGDASGGGTLSSPYLLLYAGIGIAPDGTCDSALAFTSEGYCTGEPYIELTLPAGTYTAIIFGFNNNTGTYTLERDAFTAGCAP